MFVIVFELRLLGTICKTIESVKIAGPKFDSTKALTTIIFIVIIIIIIGVNNEVELQVFLWYY